MLNPDQLTDYIDDYLNGTMSVGDISVFESALRTQPELKKDVAAQKLIRKGLKQYGKAEMKTLFKQFHTEMLEENELEAEATPVVFETRRRNTMFVIAASVALFLVVGIAIIFSGNNKDANNIAANQEVTKIEYVEQNTEVHGFATPNSTGKDYKTLILMKSDTYEKPHYEFIHRDTITLFSNSLNPKKDNLQLLFDSQTNTYKLNINGKIHEIEQGFKGVKELK
jgi:hypothetical protein